MENHHFSWENHGKSTISMAIFNSKLLNYQRVAMEAMAIRNRGFTQLEHGDLM